MTHRPIDPKYQRFRHELSECQRLGLAYVSTEPTSHLVLMADDMRRDGDIRAAQMLCSAAAMTARCQAVTIVACRRAAVAMKPRKVRR